MIDAHCHLQEFENPSEVISGLEAVICCGSGVKSSQKAVELASKYKEVFATVGVHPEDINDRDEKELRKLLKMPKVVAVGECGLDTGSDEEVDLFKFNIELAKETGLPLVVHCRNQFEKVFEALDLDRVQMHCFTGNMEQMQECVRRGWYIGLGGIVTFKSSHELREVAKEIPEDRLLIETDAPYLAPEPVRGSRNTPQNVKIVAAKISEVRGTSINQIEEITTQNARRLFGLS
ncbi:MAG: Deoxyribonuclease, TatD family [Candidatus Amesbacteria bacterium GW2011_GWA2_47_11b]|uniref:Deoxyribonuclease, TatD family n=3 Tax=Candidatus Amesiibacteriota TaxID=1752730 RepID=A0A0G1SF72_9BACT|nr:MAG: Deoxyribonuclease, TatD family [Microgenomates group bacterium GW2011_GWC1_46_20]KKU58045.1 MAG: Deoxyribonuclease, TatD family [Candidatus Amesbacteria bacterium GW2011_GWA2_47_11b]KKU68082.1 MAG: Deoxyribonuclease, TatD family [Candidatus Amesbacteria bacterium GW2011_GWA1_47_20]KKU83503.1 MAG: Deoxyribonuclease, TatD family [Candidatus Amesbacteria bacterium GW2011_GWC2_47_8]